MTGVLLAWLLLAPPAGSMTPPADGQTRASPKPTPARFTGSEAYRALRRSGREVVAEKTADLDGDGWKDALVVSRSEQGLELSAYRNTGKKGFALLSRSSVLAGEELVRFEALDLAGRQGFLLDVVEDNPDEADHRLALFVANPAGLAQVLTSGWQQKHSEEDAGRQAEEILDLGGRALGLSVMAGEADAWPEVLLRYAPKALVFPGGAGKPVRVIIGARTRRFRHAGGRYEQVSDAFDAYLEKVVARTGGAALGQRLAALPGSFRLDWDRTAPIRALGITACPRQGGGSGALRGLKILFEGAKPLTVDLVRTGAQGEGIAGVGSYQAKAGVQTLVILSQVVQASGLTLSVEAVTPAGAAACLAEVIPFSAAVDLRLTSSASSTPP